MQAEISIVYRSKRFARSVAAALAPDNKVIGNEMCISSRARGRTLNVTVKNCQRIETLEATVQDVFRCVRAAESALARTIKERIRGTL